MWLNLVQWPAMLLTIIAAWMVSSRRKFKRNWGFWIFLMSNALWIVWAISDRAYAMIVLQVCLAVMNVRGVRMNDTSEDPARSLL